MTTLETLDKLIAIVKKRRDVADITREIQRDRGEYENACYSNGSVSAYSKDLALLRKMRREAEQEAQ